MADKEIISGKQLISLVFTFIIATGTLFVPSFVTLKAGQDGWLSVLIGGISGIFVALIVTALGQRYPGKSMMEYSGSIIGKWPGKAVGLIFILFYLHITSIIVREITTTIQGTLLQNSRLESIALVLFLVCAYSVKMGLETIARANIPILIMTYLAIFTVLLLLLKDMDPRMLTPVLARGIVPVLKGSLPPMGWFCEVVSVAFIMPYVNKPGEARFCSVIGVLWAAVTLSVISALVIMVFGPQFSAVLTFPTLEAVRYISVGQYIQRVEIVFLIPWLISNYLKLCFFYYVTVLIISTWFKTGKAKTLVIPVGLVMFSLSLILFKDNLDLNLFLSQAWGYYSLPIEFGIPALLFAVALVRKKGRQKSGQKA